MMTPSLREELILSHMPQVKLLAQRLHRRCTQVELDDLISAGTIGLIQAVDRFDPKRNLKLKTLAEHRIRGALLDYLRQIDPLPRTVRRFQKQRDAVIDAFSAAGKAPGDARIGWKSARRCKDRAGSRSFNDEVYNALPNDYGSRADLDSRIDNRWGVDRLSRSTSATVRGVSDTEALAQARRAAVRHSKKLWPLAMSRSRG
jgi:RNA polymerase sigma factor (sigma-70 family)